MLNEHVLVLNRSWVAIHIASTRRALNLLFLGLARAVHPLNCSLYEFQDWVVLSQDGLAGRYIHTPRIRIRIPEVILLHHFNGMIRHEARFSRHSIFERDKNVCQYCGKLLPKTQLTIDHVVPQSRGGGDSWDNLVVACMRCNVRKSNQTPEEAGMALLRKPGRPAWLPRFGMRIPNEHLMVWKRFVDTKYWNLPRPAESTFHVAE